LGVGAQQCCARTMAGRSSAAPVRWRGAAVLRPYDGGAQQRCARTMAGRSNAAPVPAAESVDGARREQGRSSAAPVRWRGAAVLRPYDGGAQQCCARTGSGVCGWGAARVGAQQCCARTMAGRSTAAPVRWRGAATLRPYRQRSLWMGRGASRGAAVLRPYDGGAQCGCTRASSGGNGGGAARGARNCI
jgi:hypothetical protein